VSLDTALGKHPTTWEALSKLLLQQNINLVLRKNAEGRIFGITLVDNKNKVVFNGSDLGKSYSAQAISYQFGISSTVTSSQAMPNRTAELLDLGIEKMIEEVITADRVGAINYPTRKRKKKKRRRIR
jgi:hypothetical protein